MLTPYTRLSPNTEEVASKVMDGEAILINLSNGIYYSMDKVGGYVWEMIEGTHSLAEIVEAIVGRYDISPEKAQADVDRLAAELVQESLVKVSDGNASSSNAKESDTQEKLSYESPRLNIYRDMGQLLALDPPMPGLKDMTWKDPDVESLQ